MSDVKKIASQVAVDVSHAATCCVALRKVEAASTFSATWNAIFGCETWGVTRGNLPLEEVLLSGNYFVVVNCYSRYWVMPSLRNMASMAFVD